MNNIHLPEYITYTDGTRYLSSQYQITRENSHFLHLHLHTISSIISKLDDGSFHVSGNLEGVRTFTEFDSENNYPTVSQETIDEINRLNPLPITEKD